MSRVRVRLLEGEACLEARALWQEVFSEDSEAFTEYYFARKARENRGLVLEGPEGIRAMLYLTPERMRVMGEPLASAYLVGVATREHFRHRGYMARLLQEAAKLLWQEKMPFVFLLPASPAIYTPFGFTYISDRPVWDATLLKKEKLTRMGERDADRLAAFAGAFLEAHKGVYVIHDEAYYIRQAAELAAQNGCIYGLEKDGALQGICMYTCEDHVPEILEVLALPETEAEFFPRKRETQPAIMARLVCAQAFLSLLRSREEQKVAIALSDPMLPENNGVYLCHMGPEKTEVTRLEGREIQSRVPLLSVDAPSLTAAAFGYGSAADRIGLGATPLSPVWIQEIV